MEPWTISNARLFLAENWAKVSSPIAFFGINKIYDFFNGALGRTQIEKILSSFESYSVMREEKNSQNRKYQGFSMPTHLYNLCECDSFSIEELADENDSAKHVLCVINVFSKHAYCALMWDRSAESGLTALQDIFSFAQNYPDALVSDKGGECSAHVIREYLKERGTKSIIASGLNKASSVESEYPVKRRKKREKQNNRIFYDCRISKNSSEADIYIPAGESNKTIYQHSSGHNVYI